MVLGVRVAMNPFEAHQNKNRKRTVIGESLQRGSTQRNTIRSSLANVKRGAALVSELRKEGRKGRFLDNQLRGDYASSSSLGNSEAASAARRMEYLRMRKAAVQSKPTKSSVFTLASKSSVESHQHLGSLNDSNADHRHFVLTHKGLSITELDDSALQDVNGFRAEQNDTLAADGSIELLSAKTHFGGGTSQLQQPGRTRKYHTKATPQGTPVVVECVSTERVQEIYEEIIAKAKKAKADRVREQTEQEEKLEALDNQFQSLQHKLSYNPTKWSREGLAQAAAESQHDDAFEKALKGLVFEARCRPSERVKSVEELAAERVARLEILEKERLQHLELEREEEEEGESTVVHSKRKASNKASEEESDDASEDSDDTNEENSNDADEDSSNDANEEDSKEASEEDAGSQKESLSEADFSSGDGAFSVAEKSEDSGDEEDLSGESSDDNEYCDNVSHKMEQNKMRNIHSCAEELLTEDTVCIMRERGIPGQDTDLIKPTGLTTTHRASSNSVAEERASFVVDSISPVQKEKRVAPCSTEEEPLKKRQALQELVVPAEAVSSVLKIWQMDEKSIVSSVSMSNSNAQGDLPNYARNDPVPWEKHLPFQVPVPEDYEGLCNLLRQETPAAQSKLVYRMRILADPRLKPSHHQVLQRLLKYLLQYLVQVWRCFLETGEAGARRLSCYALPNELLTDAPAIQDSLQIHLLELSEAYPGTAAMFFGPLLLHLVGDFLPSVRNALEALKQYPEWEEAVTACATEQWKGTENARKDAKCGSHSSEKMVSSFLGETKDPLIQALPKFLACIRVLTAVYPLPDFDETKCVHDDIGHPFTTPAFLLLDFFAVHISNARQCNYEPVSSRECFESKIGSQEDVQPRLKKECPVGLALSLLGILYAYVVREGGERCYYSPSLLTLACAVLHALVITPSMPAACVQQVSSLIQSTLCAWSTRAGLASLDIPIAHIVLPTAVSLAARNRRPTSSKEETIAELVDFCEERLHRPLVPLHLGRIKPQGIQMLTPKYVDGTQSPGARHLRLRGCTEEQVAQKKLRKQVQTARRAASRQLRKDAEFIQAVTANEKRKQDAKREANYQRMIRTMEQDNDAIHKLRTSVVAGRLQLSNRKKDQRKKSTRRASA